MKKLLIGSLISLLLLTSCGATVVKESDLKETSDISMFIEVEAGPSWTIVYHRYTKVMYAISAGSYNYGTFTLLVNPDGTPMLWEE